MKAVITHASFYRLVGSLIMSAYTTSPVTCIPVTAISPPLRSTRVTDFTENVQKHEPPGE